MSPGTATEARGEERFWSSIGSCVSANCFRCSQLWTIKTYTLKMTAGKKGSGEGKRLVWKEDQAVYRLSSELTFCRIFEERTFPGAVLASRDVKW